MRLSSGVPGFDELIEGGLLPNRLYVVSGPPGSGKTTFTAQFMAEGLRNGEKCMYITMHETEDELVNDMSSFDFGFETLASSEGFRFINLVSPKGKHSQSVLNEGGPTNRRVAYSGRSTASSSTRRCCFGCFSPTAPRR